MFRESYGIIMQTVYQPQNWDAGTDKLDLNLSSATATTLVKLLNLSESQFLHLLYVWIAISVGLGGFLQRLIPILELDCKLFGR